MKKILGLVVGITITTNLSAQSNGNNMFDESFVHEIRITFEQENFWDSLEYYYDQYLSFGAEKKYMLAKVVIDGNTIDSVGVREKGYFSNWGSEGLKEPFKIDFNEYVSGQKYDGLKKINLQNGFGDPTLMRDAVAYRFMRDAGVAAPRSSYTKLYLNDEYWGLFIVVEQVDDRFLKNWFENDNGNLYKCIDNTSLEWQGTSKTSYEDEFELKTNEELDDWTDFIDLVDKINTDDEFEDSISTVLQMNNYTRVLAADLLMYNWDSYYDHGRNFYLYYDSTASAFQWIPWDYNLAFSGSSSNIVIGGSQPLVKNVMDSEIYREMYFNHLCVMIDNYFTLDNLGEYIDQTKALIADALAEDPNKFYTTAQFNTSIENDITVLDDWGFETIIPGLKPFFAERYTEVSAQLDSYSHSCTALGVDEIEADVLTEHTVYPNPSATGIFYAVPGEEVDQITVYSIYGQQVLNTSVTNQNTIELDLSFADAGMYIVEFSGVNKIQLKVIKP